MQPRVSWSFVSLVSLIRAYYFNPSSSNPQSKLFRRTTLILLLKLWSPCSQGSSYNVRLPLTVKIKRQREYFSHGPQPSSPSPSSNLKVFQPHRSAYIMPTHGSGYNVRLLLRKTVTPPHPPTPHPHPRLMRVPVLSARGI